MILFTVRPQGAADYDAFDVRGTDYKAAAAVVAHRQWGRSAVALRVTGSLDKSGVFQAYKSARQGGQTSVGEPFHMAAQW